MIVVPAIDIRHGQVVRLRQGRSEEQTTYGHDPAAAARELARAQAGERTLDALGEAHEGPLQLGDAVRQVVDFIPHKPSVQPADGQALVCQQFLLEAGYQDP